jgi:transcriptional regulator with XRE-family HTH domain
MEARTILARNVVALRRARGLSQEELCRRAQLTRSYLWAIEKGTRNPSLDVIARLAEVLGVEPHELLTP